MRDDEMEDLLGRLTPRGVRPELREKVLDVVENVCSGMEASDGFQKGTVAFSSDENRDSPPVVFSQVLRRIVKMRSVKISAGALVSASVAALMIVAFRPVPSAFAEAIKLIREAHTISFTGSLTHRGVSIPFTAYYRDDGRLRAEYEGGAMIMDLAAKKTTGLDLGKKTAKVTTISPEMIFGDIGVPVNELIQTLKRTAVRAEDLGKVEKELDEKELNGKRVRGFVVAISGGWITFWLDKATGRPVRIESDCPTGYGNFKVALTDIKIDPKLDESLFSLDGPPGYKVTRLTAPDVRPGLEATLIDSLERYMMFSGGKLPSRLDDQTQWKKLIEKLAKEAERTLTEKQRQEMYLSLHQREIGGYLAGLGKEEVDYAYVGQGKGPGEQNHKEWVVYPCEELMIFWYEKPDGGYRAIYRATCGGEFSAKDVKPEDLPKGAKPLGKKGPSEDFGCHCWLGQQCPPNPPLLDKPAVAPAANRPPTSLPAPSAPRRRCVGRDGHLLKHRIARPAADFHRAGNRRHQPHLRRTNAQLLGQAEFVGNGQPVGAQGGVVDQSGLGPGHFSAPRGRMGRSPLR